MDPAHALPSEPEVDGPVPAVPAAVPAALDDRDRDILAFERQWWRYAGAKEQAVRARFNLSTTRYHQVLNALIDKPDALVVDPMLVRRLRRLRATRRHARATRLQAGGETATP